MSMQPVPDALAGEKMICVDFLNLENGATVFMVTGSLSGQQIHVLLDQNRDQHGAGWPPVTAVSVLKIIFWNFFRPVPD